MSYYWKASNLSKRKRLEKNCCRWTVATSLQPFNFHIPSMHAQETCTRNLWKSSCTRITVSWNGGKHCRCYCHFSTCINNNWSANHVARFESRAGEFLCWNRAVLNCVQETCKKKLVPHWPTRVQVSGTSFLSECYRHYSSQMLSEISHRCLCNNQHCNIQTSWLEIDIYYSELVHCLMEAFRYSIPRIPKSSLKHHWSATLDDLKCNCISAHDIWFSSGSPGQGPVYEKKLN